MAIVGTLSYAAQNSGDCAWSTWKLMTPWAPCVFICCAQASVVRGVGVRVTEHEVDARDLGLLLDAAG